MRLVYLVLANLGRRLTEWAEARSTQPHVLDQIQQSYVQLLRRSPTRGDPPPPLLKIKT